MSIWPVMDGVEQLQRGSGLILGADGHRYAGVMELALAKALAISPSWTSYIHQIYPDGDFLYVFTRNASTDYPTLGKYRISDLSFVETITLSTGYTGDIADIAIDESFLYCLTSSLRIIFKFDKTTFSLVGQSENADGYLRSLGQDDNYLYTVANNIENSSSTHRVYKYSKADLTKVAESATNIAKGGGRHLIVCGTRLYLSTSGMTTVALLNTPNLSRVAGSQDIGGVSTLAVDEDSVFAVGVAGANMVYKFDPANLTTITLVAHPSATNIECLGMDEEILYAGTNQNTVSKFDRQFLRFIGDSPPNGASVLSLAVIPPYFYIGGNAPFVITQFENIYGISGYRRID